MNEFEVTRRASILSLSYAKKIEDEREDEKEDEENSGLKGDYLNMVILLILYILQGIPAGLISTIPMIFSANNVPYNVQAIFSFASYPYAIKLLWAPIVDSVYSKRFGRRKTWLIPTQYAIGIAMMTLAPFSEELIGDAKNAPKIYWLTVTTFVVFFLVATQDIAGDAWGLTILSKRNLHYLPSAGSVGSSIGAFLTTTLYLSLESPKFCNEWLRSEPQEFGIVNIRQLFYSIGALFIIFPTIICIFKREKEAIYEEETSGIISTYKYLLNVLRLKPILSFILIQMTYFVSFSVFMAAFGLKLIQYGVRREVLSLMSTPITIMNFFLPFIIVHLTKNKPLHHFWRFGVARVFVQCISIVILFWTQSFNQPTDGEFPFYFYTTLFLLGIISEIISYTNLMSIGVFMISVADPKFGGTYMTLFATIGQIGIKWVVTLSLALLDPLTIEKYIDCDFNDTTAVPFNNDKQRNITIISQYNSTSNLTEVERQPEILVDGFYIQAAFCTVYALFWFIFFKGLIWKMQKWPISNWRISKVNNENEDEAKSVDVPLTSIKSI